MSIEKEITKSYLKMYEVECVKPFTYVKYVNGWRHLVTVK